ncbi:type 1 glutamine amidotransferase [Cohnella endophytica]|uniref:Type 1 glutamine amidotransferase n=1 Tax=Cohnella endophytica TaxID=2419778 RepID=A0A494XT83_9BACL|nr:type 1 glutamine amidotransferase domain-containing protein [Cohnella endophytica]RKP53820.1 type 1 glutamine amidotransferase [Cohnella endophytica]
MKQMTKKVAFLLADEFEDSEMSQPFDALIENGTEGVIISKEKEAELKGKNGTVSYVSHLAARDAQAGDYEAVVIPGGKSPSHLRDDESVLRFVKEAEKLGIPIAAICHGPQVLASAGLLQGKTLTSFPGISEEMIQAGGTFVDREVVEDGNLITSRKPEDEPAFIDAIIRKIGVSAY